MRKILFILILFLCQSVYGAVPITFTEGTVASAVEVNQNFNYFENKFSLTSGHDHDGASSRKILKGEWQGTVVDEIYGGTGQSVYSSGDILYATADTGLVRLARPTNLGGILLFGSGASQLEWLESAAVGKKLESMGVGLSPEWIAGGQKVGFFSRDTSLATGTQAVTGVGFKPTALIFWGAQSSADEASWGHDDGANSVCISDNNDVAAGTYTFQNANSIYDTETTNNTYTAVVDSLDSDGFTISWTRNNTPEGTFSVAYIALR